jgi:hypothetical protein
MLLDGTEKKAQHYRRANTSFHWKIGDEIEDRVVDRKINCILDQTKNRLLV